MVGRIERRQVRTSLEVTINAAKTECMSEEHQFEGTLWDNREGIYTNLENHQFLGGPEMDAIIHSLIHSFINSSVQQLFHSSIHPSPTYPVQPPICSSMHPFVSLRINLFILSFIHSLNHSPIYQFLHSFIQSFTYLSIHSSSLCIHPSIHQLLQPPRVRHQHLL